MAENVVLYTAVYENVTAALDDLDALEQLHEDELVGKYDAAVIDKENGKPHIAKRVDRPRIRAIPEMFGGGTLPRKELKEAAQELTSGQAGLIVVGEPTNDCRPVVSSPSRSTSTTSCRTASTTSFGTITTARSRT